MIKVNQYPFIRCLNPQRIYNKYIDKEIVAPCGKCEACLLQKSAMYTLKCRLESEFNNYCYFVTLTYNEENIPKFRFVRETDVDIADDSNEHFYVAVDVSNNPKYNCRVLGHVSADELDISSLQNRNCRGEDIAYLRQEDAQLFLKRLRKKITNEKIRYYCIGEYGPKHLRPHWHLLLWFNQEETAQNLRNYISEAWRLGYIHVGKSSSGKASSYVAGYVNSRLNIPSLLNLPETKSKCTHSAKLGEAFIQDSIKEVHSQEYRDFVRRSYSFSNGTTDFSLWRSLKSRYFPKCMRFTTSDSSQLYETYTIVPRLREILGIEKPYEIAKAITFLIREQTESFSFERRSLDLQYYIDFIINKVEHIDFRIPFKPHYWEKLFQRIYRIMFISGYFVDFVCDANPNLYRTKINSIIEFYSKEELSNIADQVQRKNMILNSPYPEDVKFLYLDDLPLHDFADILDSFAGRNFNVACQHNWQNSVKHKRQNDEIDMFNPENLRYNGISDEL